MAQILTQMQLVGSRKKIGMKKYKNINESWVFTVAKMDVQVLTT